MLPAYDDYDENWIDAFEFPEPNPSEPKPSLVQHRYKIRIEYGDPFTLEYSTKWVVATTDVYDEDMLWYTGPYGEDQMTFLSHHPEAEHVSVVQLY